MGSSGAQIRKNISEIREIMKKKLKSPVSIEFAHSILYFERPANLMSKEIKPAYSTSNIKIHVVVDTSGDGAQRVGELEGADATDDA